MIGCVHLAVGAAIGSGYSAMHRQDKFTGQALNWARIGVATAIGCAAYISHSVCDSFPHTHYLEIGIWGLAMAAADFLTFWYLLRYHVFKDVDIRLSFRSPRLFPRSLKSLLHSMSFDGICVGCGMFWAVLPDGIVMILGKGMEVLTQWQPDWVKSYTALHLTLHAPVPSWGVWNQITITIVALVVVRLTSLQRLRIADTQAEEVEVVKPSS